VPRLAVHEFIGKDISNHQNCLFYSTVTIVHRKIPEKRITKQDERNRENNTEIIPINNTILHNFTIVR